MDGGIDEHFQAFDIVAGTSGGSWWGSSTLYSGEIPDMLEEMAASPSQAGDIFHNTWSLNTRNQLRRLSDQHFAPVDSLFCGQLPAGFNPERNFLKFVHQPTSIPDGATLSLKPNRSWAEGKIFLVTGSVPSPGSNGTWEDERVWVHFTYGNVTTNEVNGSIFYRGMSSRNETFPLWIPAKWSFRLGDAADAHSPLPFCGEEDCHGLFLEYTGYSQDSGEIFTAFSRPLGEIFDSAFEEGAGSVHMGQVTTVSSSFVASVAVEAAAQGGYFPAYPAIQAACKQFATWTAEDSWGHPFSPEDSQITQELIMETAASGLQAFNDGAWTDNSAVAAAVGALTSAANCTESRNLSVTAMLNGPVADDGLPGLFPGAGKELGPICSSPTYSEVLEVMSNNSLLPNFTAQLLVSINYGTIKCQTVDNPLYGVKAGFTVDIHFVWAKSIQALDVTPNGVLANFGLLAGEIVQTMVYHNETLMDVAAMIFPKVSDSTTTSENDETSTGVTDEETTSMESTSMESTFAPDADADFAMSVVRPPHILLLSLFLSGFL